MTKIAEVILTHFWAPYFPYRRSDWRRPPCRLAGFALVFKSEALVGDLHDVGMVQKPIQHGGGERLIVSKGARPLGKGQVAGQHHAGLFVAFGDYVEEPPAIRRKSRAKWEASQSPTGHQRIVTAQYLRGGSPIKLPPYANFEVPPMERRNGQSIAFESETSPKSRRFGR